MPNDTAGAVGPATGAGARAEVEDLGPTRYWYHYDEHFAGHPTRPATARMLEHIAERIGGLLDGDRGQP